MLDIWRSQTWATHVEKVVAAHLPVSVVRRIRQIPAETMYADTMSYLEDALREEGFWSFETERKMLESAVIHGFSTIRGFHACKPLSFGPYLERGITPLTREWLANEAYELFEGTFSHDEIDALVAEADLNQRLGMLFFCTDPKDLIESAGRYLAYGPESICCVFGGDGGRFYEARERQRRRGIPTMIECAVPLAAMSESWRAEVASKLVTDYFRKLSVKIDREARSRDFSIAIDAALPARYIIGHFHPELIDDTHRPYEPYRNLTTKCPFC